jgi:predicted O-linked N-acetylglucosamine transferase (SPINDLY family)
VAENLWPILSNHDQNRIDWTCYSLSTVADHFTAQIRARANSWVLAAGLSDQDLAARIRADQIDILVFVGGLFDNNRLGVASYRPAPIQVSFHDGATSAMAEMDYFISDADQSPKTSSERFSERVIRLPKFGIRNPIQGAPDVGGLPLRKNGHVTFGSLNNPAKLNDSVLMLWGDVLRSVAHSRLRLKYFQAFASTRLQERIIEKIGVPPERIHFDVAPSPSALAALEFNNEIDIALDPFPFCGATTSFEALWMGIPVITMVQGHYMGRFTLSMLKALELDDFIAPTPEAYISTAMRWATKPHALAEIRATLRDRMTASALCQGTSRAHSVDRLYTAIWRRWTNHACP